VQTGVRGRTAKHLADRTGVSFQQGPRHRSDLVKVPCMSADDTEVFPKVENTEDSHDESGLAAFDRAADREAERGDDTGQQAAVDGAEVATRKRKRSPWVSALMIVGVLALVCTGTAVGLALGLEHRYENKVTREDILGDLPKAGVPLGTKTAPMNFLMLGSD